MKSATAVTIVDRERTVGRGKCTDPIVPTPADAAVTIERSRGR